jgi:tetratricopeptide (TPR) repeat protein
MVRALDDALSAPPPRRRVAAGATDATRVMGGTVPPARPARAGPPSPAPRRGWGAGAVVALAALLLVVAGAIALMSGGGDAPPDRPARQEPKATATPKAKATPTATPAEPTATPAPAEQPQSGNGKAKGKDKGKQSSVAGEDPTTLQLKAFELNNAGQPEQALPYAQKAVDLCKGSDAIDPCAYALFEYARSLRMTGDPEAAIAALEERKQRFPGNQAGAVERELALAREAAG